MYIHHLFFYIHGFVLHKRLSVHGISIFSFANRFLISNEACPNKIKSASLL